MYGYSLKLFITETYNLRSSYSLIVFAKSSILDVSQGSDDVFQIKKIYMKVNIRRSKVRGQIGSFGIIHLLGTENVPEN